MSKDKLVLAVSPIADGRRRVWPAVLGCVVTAVSVIVAAVLLWPGTEPDDIRAGNGDSAFLGMADLSDDMADIWIQNMSADSPNKPERHDDRSGNTPVDLSDPSVIRGRITRNQTLFVALKNLDLDIADIQQIITSLQDVMDFRKVMPGDMYEIHLDADRRILSFTYTVSPEDISISERVGNSFVSRKADVHKRIERILVKGELEESLYKSFVRLGESGELAGHFMRLFKYDIDFVSDSQQGDEFSMVVDKVTLDGRFYRYGRVWAATYGAKSKGRVLEAYYYDTNEEDYAGYYDAQGRALRRTFLKTPVVGCRVTSPFDPKRFHPILRRIRPHNGIDFGCPTGTPVMAFADGTVTFAGWKGGNGNLLVIEHPHGYVSLYAHLYGFAAGVRRGAKVRQGQLVAKVGNTGMSTGPHLHFGVKLNGSYINPAAIDTTRAYTLTGRRLHAFSESRKSLVEILAGRNGDSSEVLADAGVRSAM